MPVAGNIIAKTRFAIEGCDAIPKFRDLTAVDAAGYKKIYVIILNAASVKKRCHEKIYCHRFCGAYSYHHTGTGSAINRKR
jgi:hypothetical protein